MGSTDAQLDTLWRGGVSSRADVWKLRRRGQWRSVRIACHYSQGQAGARQWQARLRFSLRRSYSRFPRPSPCAAVVAFLSVLRSFSCHPSSVPPGHRSSITDQLYRPKRKLKAMLIELLCCNPNFSLVSYMLYSSSMT